MKKKIQDDEKEFKDEFKEVRETLLISQEKFAHALGISYATVSRIEKQGKEPDNETKRKFLKLKDLIIKIFEVKKIKKVEGAKELKELGKAIENFGVTSILEAGIEEGLIKAPAPAITALKWVLGKQKASFGGSFISLILGGVSGIIENNSDQNKK